MYRKLLKVDLIYLFALAIFGTIFYGLLINTVLPMLGIQSPLSAAWVWPVYTLYLLPLYKLVDQTSQWLMNHSESLVLKLLILLNPFLAIMGANYVNNDGGGAIAIASLLLICLDFTWIMIRSKDDLIQNERTYKAFLYSAALSLIYAFALRSSYLSGYDIHQEFQVFKITGALNIWSMDTLRDAYNACLSITILPTIIRNLTGLPELVVFRVVYPLILAMIPIGVYIISTRFLSNKLAYLGAFLFLIQAQYFNQLPALLRQGVAFLFFTLLVDSLIRRDVSRRYTQQSVLVFGTGIVLSHYSTTYTTIAVLILAKIAITMGELFILKTRKTTILSIWILAYLVGITLLWNVIITDTAGGLTRTFSKVFQNIGTVFSFENKSDAVKGIFYGRTDNNFVVNKYADTVIAESPNALKYLDYKIKPVSIPNGTLTSLRNPIALYFFLIIPWTFRLMILGGFIVLIRHYLRYYQTYAVVTVSSAMMVVVAMIVILPTISVNYNFERLFQQMLILLAPVSIMSIWKLKQLVSKLPTYSIMTILCISYLLQTSGIVSKVFFNSSTWIIDNSGETYYRYYTTQRELLGIRWLYSKAPDKILLYADKYSQLRILAYIDNYYKRISTAINPPLIQNNSYILQGNTASMTGVVFSDYQNVVLRYGFPSKFTDYYKNTIYSNSTTRIYK